jgi:hypothetical protein
MRHQLNILLWKLGGAFVPFMALLVVPVYGSMILNIGLIASVIIWANTAGYLEGRNAEKKN